MSRIFKFLRKAIKIVSIAGLSLQIFLAFMMILIDLPAGFMLAIIFVVFDLLLWFNFGKPTIYKNIIIGSSLMIVFLTGCIYAILFRIVNLAEIPSQYHIGKVSDWILYSGSIIGGSMTMFALLFTIQHEDKKRKEDKANSILPIFELVSPSKNPSKFHLIYLPVSNQPLRSFGLKEQNFGDNSRISNLLILEDIPFIPIIGERVISFDVNEDAIPNDLVDETYFVKLIFEYSDILSIKRYHHKIEFFLRIRSDGSKQKLNYFMPEGIKNFAILDSKFIDT